MSGDPYAFELDALDFKMRMGFGLGSVRHQHAVIRPEPGKLPEPLERAANAMYDAKSDDEAKAAAREFLTLSEEWTP